MEAPDAPHTAAQQAAANAVDSAARALGRAIHAAEGAGLRVEVEYRPTEWLETTSAAGAGLLSGEPGSLRVECFALLAPTGEPEPAA